MTVRESRAFLTPTPPATNGRRDHSLPTVSVIIAARNEETALADCLAAVVRQDYPALLEILVVDGRSDDRSRDVVTACAERDGRVRLIDNPAGLIPTGLNIGVRQSLGDVIVRVDARTRLAPDYISTGIRLLHETGASNVGGPVRGTTTSYTGRLLALATESRFGMGGAAVRYRGGANREVDTVYLGIYPRAALERVGLYDEELVRDQDDELNYRLRERGGRIVMSATLRTSYLNSASLRRFIRQNFLYGYWKVRVWQKHRRLISARHLVPPTFVLGVAAGIPLAVRNGLAARVLAVVGGAYVCGATGAAIRVGASAGWRYVPALPAVFFALHASWGAGFVAGAVRFLPRWLSREPAPPSLPRREHVTRGAS